ncbi:hypothetical protein [Nostoc sp. NZL]|nr:hypothetical protein [Nostoc sp. NZL]
MIFSVGAASTSLGDAAQMAELLYHRRHRFTEANRVGAADRAVFL